MEQIFAIGNEDLFGFESDEYGNNTLINPGFGFSISSLASTFKSLYNSTIERLGVSYNKFEASDTRTSIEVKEREWHKLVGKKKFQSLNEDLQNFLINTAGMIDLGFSIDIKKAYKYSICDDED